MKYAWRRVTVVTYIGMDGRAHDELIVHDEGPRGLTWLLKDAEENHSLSLISLVNHPNVPGSLLAVFEELPS